MPHRSKPESENLFLRKLGKHIESIILERGYNSAYDFWVRKASDHISRAALNYLLAGETDPKISTLRLLARLLNVPPEVIYDINRTIEGRSTQKRPVQKARKSPQG